MHDAVWIIRINVSRALGIGEKSGILVKDIHEKMLKNLAENCNEYIKYKEI